MFFLRRFLLTVPLLLAITLIAFLLVRVAPGGPFDRERQPASPEVEKALQARYHLDRPVIEQYLRYLGLWWESRPDGSRQRVAGGLLLGDLGPSLKYRSHSVNDILGQALPVSATLGFLAFGFALGVGIPWGFYSAIRRGAWPDTVGNTLALLAICIPALILGPVLVMAFALRARWFPVALWESPWHAVLPTVTLGLFFAGRIARLLREGMRTTLEAEYITTARAKGLRESTVLWKHAFRLALLPVVSYSGPLLADLLTGSFVVENLFQIPGIGVFLVNSTLNRDYTLVVGLVITYAVLLLLLNLLVDLVYLVLDPRVRYE